MDWLRANYDRAALVAAALFLIRWPFLLPEPGRSTKVQRDAERAAENPILRARGETCRGDAR